MSDSLGVLLLTTGSIGFFHTIMGPDHYLPFIVMSRSSGWSIKKTISITLLCGTGHVLSSVFLSIIAIILGLTVLNLELIESLRGMIAGWALIAFGLVYMIWGIKNILKNKTHEHRHLHIDGQLHNHKHVHTGNHSHLHKEADKKNITPWILFLIFVLGPCESLIPLLMYPALNNDMFGVILVTVIFTLATLVTMSGIIIVSFYGINFVSFKWLERYKHAFAGLTIFLCGFAIQFLEL
jgi:ABC-type nickel/cobalt efflux system permease component RcnA